jgi:hypothetical protein
MTDNDDDKYLGAAELLAEVEQLLDAQRQKLAAHGVLSTRLADTAPEHVRWLWPGRLPLGKLVVLDGDPDIGKSTLTLDLAARVTTGSPMPDGEPLDMPANVILMSAEDGLADTIRPRFDAAGGNPARVWTFDGVLVAPDEPDGEWTRRPPQIPADLGRLRDLIAHHQARLVIVDVLTAYLSAKVDSYRDQDIRAALMPLADVAEQTHSTIIAVRHLNKSGGNNPLYRGGGSIGIIGAARVGLLAGGNPDHPDDDTRRVLAVTKCNLDVKPPALGYRIYKHPEHCCAAVTWEGPTSHTAGDLLGRADRDDDRSDAANALEEILLAGEGALWVKPALEAMAAAGFSKDQAKRAKAILGVRSRKVGKPGAAEQGWQWVLPPEGSAHTPEEAEERGLFRPHPFSPFGPLGAPFGNGTSPEPDPDPPF